MDINEIPIPEAPAAEATGCETPPSPPQAPQWNPAGPPVKERRVGRLTLGVTLIATGVVLLLTMFVPGFSLFTVAKFAPVILILIGVEILVNVCVARGVRLRYDFLSMFVCFLLICGSLCVSAVPMIYQNVVVREHLEYRLSDRIESDVYHAVEGEGIAGVSCHLSLEGSWDAPLKEDMTYQEVGDVLTDQWLTIRLDQNFESTAEFAQKARRILDRLESLDLPGARVEIAEKDWGRSLEIFSSYQWELPAEKLEELCSQREELQDIPE